MGGLDSILPPRRDIHDQDDLLIEKGLEAIGAPYFDGFVGTYSGRFRTDLVDEELADEGLRLPSRWARVWKLHGSISWAIQTAPDRPAILRIGSESVGEAEIPLAIYPSLKKYQESRREPFVTLADRLRRALAVPETLVITCGYSFGDQHINEVLYDAARYYPRSEIVATFFDTIPTGVVAEAKRLPNLSALGPASAVIGSSEAEWEFGDSKLEFTEGGRYRLGDFARLATFLSRGRTASGRPQPLSPG